MDELLPFIVPACGVLFAIQGAWGLYSSVRRARRLESEVGATLKPSSQVAATVLTRLWMRRFSGVFWFCLGIATIAFAGTRTPWILRSVGLLWAVIGAWTFASTFLQSRQAAEAAVVNATSAASPADARRRLRRRQLASAFSLCVGIAMVAFSGLRVGASPAAVSQPPEHSDRLAEIVTQHGAQAFEEQGRVGLVIGAVAGDEEVLLGFGTRQLGESQPPDADTVFEIGSISKVFTGILLAQAIESGELKLDDRIADLLPDGWTLSESAREITLQHCTTHTSGFPRLPDNLLGPTVVFRGLFGGDPYRDYSEDQFRDALATVELEFEPGTDRAYSNFAVGLLGFVLAKYSGSDYEKLVTSRICQPLGMDRTVITGDEWIREHLAAKYRSALKLGPATVALTSDEWVLQNHLAGAGAIRSTGRDMLAFLKANMGRISTPFDAAIQRSHQELFQERADQATGMNWARSFEHSISQNIIWHNGGTGGFRAYLGFTEDRHCGVFVLSNTASDVDDLAEEILETLVEEYAPGSRKLVTEHGYAKVAPYSGIRWENDRPIVEVEGRWSPLVSIDGMPIEQIMEFAQQEFGDKARKRMAEDLVELLSKMGHEPQWEVTLGLEAGDGQVEQRKIAMTAENRDRVRE